MDEKRYPIGQFEKPAIISREHLAAWTDTIAAFPENLMQAIATFTDEQLDTPYRAGGWTLRQVVHHCADSHMQAFCRIKLALTENKPVIKPYAEARWAELADSKILPVDASVALLMGLHQRWALLLQSLTEKDLESSFIHPEQGREIKVAEAIGMYAWHCRHHLAHLFLPKFTT